MSQKVGGHSISAKIKGKKAAVRMQYTAAVVLDFWVEHYPATAHPLERTAWVARQWWATEHALKRRQIQERVIPTMATQKTKQPKRKKLLPKETSSPKAIEVLTEEKNQPEKQIRSKGGMKHGALTKKTQRAIKLVLEHGVDEKTALVLAGNGKMVNRSSVGRFKEKVRKYALSSPQMVKKAYSAIKDTLEMKPITYEVSKPVSGVGVVDYTETIMPSITNRLAAAAMVMDRDQPVVRQNVNLNANVDVSPVDMSKYFNR